MSQGLSIEVGLKSDPIEYRYSFPWLFRLMADEGVSQLQLGSFVELYHLPDDWFVELRAQAQDHGITIASTFTAHRELGGFFVGDPRWEAVARRNFERHIEVGALLGARHVGSNPGAVLRDHADHKEAGIACYLRHMKELMGYAHDKGLDYLTMEPMSCRAEPPSLPEEIRAMAEELAAYHHATPNTVPVGYCSDTSHGLANAQGKVEYSPLSLFEATYPWLVEFHVKNTDARFDATFGFSKEERKRGIVSLEALRQSLEAKASDLPVDKLVAYLEIGGPKLGRDYSDSTLEGQLRASLAHLKSVFAETSAGEETAPVIVDCAGAVEIAPSLMCADLCHFEESVRELEACKADWLHIDIMDAQFTPNMPLGFEIFKQLRPKTSVPFDAHLMVCDNDFFVRQMADLGAQQVSVHVESCRHLDRILALIRSLGMRAGAALNPATPLSVLDYVHERLDFVMLMTVNPGYAGQKMVPSSLRKIADCRDYLAQHGLDIPIEVDGNVSLENIPAMVAAGADILVAGTSSVYRPGYSMEENFTATRQAIAQGVAMR